VGRRHDGGGEEGREEEDDQRPRLIDKDSNVAIFYGRGFGVKANGRALSV
jgi:hypothetical protein